MRRCTREQITPVSTRERIWGYAAEFTPAAITSAAKKVAVTGYRWWDCHCCSRSTAWTSRWASSRRSFRSSSSSAADRHHARDLPAGFTNSLEVNLWAIVPVIGYQFEVSGKPLISASPVPVMFEVTVLLGR